MCGVVILVKGVPKVATRGDRLVAVWEARKVGYMEDSLEVYSVVSMVVDTVDDLEVMSAVSMVVVSVAWRVVSVAARVAVAPVRPPQRCDTAFRARHRTETRKVYTCPQSKSGRRSYPVRLWLDSQARRQLASKSEVTCYMERRLQSRQGR